MSVKIFVFLLFMLQHFSIQAQVVLTWDILAEVTWVENYDEELATLEISGSYSDHLMSYNGKEVIISGYVIPLDALGLSYALSRSSFASCFFCGQAGPETVLDLNVKPKSIPSYRQKDQMLKFKGVLLIRESDKLGFHYSLDNAIEIE